MDETIPWVETDDGPSLLGGRSKQDGKITFPMPSGSEAEFFEQIHLKREGKLWAYTVQRFPPKSPPFLGVNSPDEFKPYVVGYIELEGQVIVESRIETDDLDALELGQDMVLTTIDLARGDGEGHFMTFAFKAK